MTRKIAIERLVGDDVSGPILKLSAGLSFWGGLNPETGVIVDRQHPERNRSVRATVLVLPGIRGSTASPGALLDCLEHGTAPVAILMPAVDAAPLAASFTAIEIGLAPISIATIIDPSGLDSLPASGRLHVGAHEATLID